VQQSVSRIFGEVQKVFAVTFGKCCSLKHRLFVVHVAPFIAVDEIVNLLLERRDAPMPQVGGRYLIQVGSAVICGVPDSSVFLETTTHELAHAACHAVLGGVGFVPWANEGWACFVAEQVAKTCYRQSFLSRHLAAVDSGAGTKLNLSLRMVLLVENQETEMAPDRIACFQSSAFLFVQFLLERAASCRRIAEALRAALCETPPNCRAQVETLEKAFGKEVEHIERDFINYCMDLRARAAEKEA